MRPEPLSVLSTAREFPDAPCLITERVSYSFAEIADDVRKVVSWLRAQGIGEKGQQRVALVASATRENLIAIYALLEFGVPMLLLHPRYTADERAAWLGRVPVAFTIDETWEFPKDITPAAELPARDIDASQAQVLIPTSGSAGVEKCVVLSRSALIAAAQASAEVFAWQEHDRWLLSLPPAHIGGFSIITRCLIARKPVVLSERPSFDPEYFVATLSEFKVSLVSMVPTMLQRVLERYPTWSPDPALRAVLLGGAASAPSLIRHALERGIPVRATYGCTEAASQIATQRAASAAGDVGLPLPGIELRIRDQRIEIRGPMLFDGYLVDAAVQSACDTEGWFATQDLGELDAEGKLRVLGRADRVLISGGENVCPEEVEEVLRGVVGVRDAYVFGVRDAEWGEKVAAVIEVAEIAKAPPLELLRDQLQAKLAGYKQPRLYCFSEALPRKALSKLNRGAIEREYRSRLKPL